MLQAHPHGARADPGFWVRSPASLGPGSPRRAPDSAQGDFRRAWGLGLLVPWPRPHRTSADWLLEVAGPLKHWVLVRA